MIELLINGEVISGIEEIRLTKAVNDLGDLPSRQGEFSTTIDVPLTKSNCLALANVEQINNVTKLYNKLNTYELYESGVLVSNGTARILNVKESIQVVLLSNNSDWTGLINDASLRDLDVRENDYALTIPEVEARRLNTTKMCTPNVFYNFISLAEFRPADLKPCFFVNYLMDKIFNGIGFTLNNKMSAGAKAIYDKIITIPTSLWVQPSYQGIAYKATIAYSDNGGVGWYEDLLLLGGNKHLVGSGKVEGFPYIGKGAFPAPASQVITVNCELRKPKRITGYVEFETDTNQPWPYFTNLFFVNIFGVEIGRNTDVLNAGVYRIDFDKDISSLPEGIYSTKLYFECDLVLLGGVGTYKILGGEITVYDDGYEQCIQNLEFGQDIIVDTAGCLPDIPQTSLISTVANLFLLLFTTDTINKVVSIVELQQVVDNIPNAIDWSDKVDLSEGHEIVFDFLDNYFQRNWFRYKDDEKDPYIFGTGLGSSFIDFDNGNLPPSGDVYESTFSAISRGNYSGNLNIDKIIAKCEFFPDEELNPKIGVSKITSDNIIRMQDSILTPSRSNEVFFDDISFANLIPLNYASLQRILANNTVIKMLFRLTRNDFANFDFTIPLYIDVMTEKGHVRGHFYVNKIDQYNVGANDSCEVTLIQID
jgi:hypothetical protein